MLSKQPHRVPNDDDDAWPIFSKINYQLMEMKREK